MNAAASLAGFFGGPADASERLVSALEYCCSSSSGLGARFGSTPREDELSEVLEKGTFYRGMVDFGSAAGGAGLLARVETILSKFSELRQRLVTVRVSIDVSRGTLTEANQAWSGLVRRIGKISNRGSITMHALTTIGDDVVVSSFHPNPIRTEPIRQALLHIASDVHLYDGTSPRSLSVMLDSLLVREDNAGAGAGGGAGAGAGAGGGAGAARVRRVSDRVQSSSTSSSVSKSMTMAFTEHSLPAELAAPTSFSVVLVVDASTITSLARSSDLHSEEVDLFVDRVLELTTDAVKELRKDEKLATIKSMRRLVESLESVISIEQATWPTPPSERRQELTRQGGGGGGGEGVRISNNASSLSSALDVGHVFAGALEGAIVGQSLEPARKSASSPAKLPPAAPVLSTDAATRDLSGEASRSWKRQSYVGDDDQPRTGESINVGLGRLSSSGVRGGLGVGTNGGGAGSLSTSRWSIALAAAEDAVEKATAESIALGFDPAAVANGTTLSPQSSPVSAKSVALDKDSPRKLAISTSPDPRPKSPPTAAPLSPLVMQELIDSRASEEDLVAFSMRAYRAIRDDVLADVVSQLRDSTILSSSASQFQPQLQWSVAETKSSDELTPPVHAEDKLTSSQRMAPGGDYDFKRAFAVTTRQSSAFLEAKRAAVEPSSPARPGTAPAAARYEDKQRETAARSSRGSERPSLGHSSPLLAVAGKLSGTAMSPASRLHQSLESIRSSLSSLSSMGSPPGSGPATPHRAAQRDSSFMSFSLRDEKLEKSERPKSSAGSRPGTATSTGAKSKSLSTAGSVKGGLTTTPANSPPAPSGKTSSGKSSPRAFETTPSPRRPGSAGPAMDFRPGTAASAASRDRGAAASSRAQSHRDLYGYATTGVSPAPSPKPKATPRSASMESKLNSSKPTPTSSREKDGSWSVEYADTAAAAVSSSAKRQWEADPSLLPRALLEHPGEPNFYDDEEETGEGGNEEEQEEKVDGEIIEARHVDESDEVDAAEYYDPWGAALPPNKQEQEQEHEHEHEQEQEHEHEYEQEQEQEQEHELEHEYEQEQEHEAVYRDEEFYDVPVSNADGEADDYGDAVRDTSFSQVMPVSVFTSSALLQLKAQLEASRAEIESSRLQKENEAIEKRRSTALNVLKALEGKARPVSAQPQPPVEAVHTAAAAAAAAAAVPTEQPPRRSTAFVIEAPKSPPREKLSSGTTSAPAAAAAELSSDARAMEQRRVRFLQDAEARALAREAKRRDGSDAASVTEEPPPRPVRGASTTMQHHQHQPQSQSQSQSHTPPLPPQHQHLSQAAGASATGHYRSRTLANKLSNQQQVKNAISNVCLAGVHFEAQRVEALGAIDYWHLGEGAETRRRDLLGAVDTTSPTAAVTHFVILFFHSKSLAFRGLYAVDPFTHNAHKIFGRGPKALPTNCIEDYFKYESSSRSFKKLPVKSLSSTVDAVSVDPSQLKKLQQSKFGV